MSARELWTRVFHLSVTGLLAVWTLTHNKEVENKLLMRSTLPKISSSLPTNLAWVLRKVRVSTSLPPFTPIPSGRLKFRGVPSLFPASWQWVGPLAMTGGTWN